MGTVIKNQIFDGERALYGIKALRECEQVQIACCDINSPEFGWYVKDITMKDTTAQSEYFLMRSRDITMERVTMSGKYSFQYVENGVLDQCNLDTKDAFWHAKNVVIRNSVIRGEYLAWYSENVTLENCTIIGTQPFCYCKNLLLIHCKMMDTDLAFEKSDVEAEIDTKVLSIKNPKSGTIYVADVGEIIRDDASAKGNIIIKKS